MFADTSPVMRFAVVVAAALTLGASSAAGAQDFYNSYGRYNVSYYTPPTTAFGGVHQLNGFENELCCFGRDQSEGTPDDRLLVKFIADPGYSFTKMAMGFTQFAYRTNAGFGYNDLWGRWSASNGTFAPGSDSWSYGGGSDKMGWDQTGTAGSFYRYFSYQNSGGVMNWMPLMSGVDFANVQEFTLDVEVGGNAAGSFGTYLDVYAETVNVPATITATPEPASVVLMLTGVGAVGLMARRRKPIA